MGDMSGDKDKRTDGKRKTVGGVHTRRSLEANRDGQAGRFTKDRLRAGGARPKQRPEDFKEEARRSRLWGFLLIGTGSLSLVLTLMFSGIPALSAVPEKISRMWTHMTSRFKVWIYGPGKEPSPWDFSDVKPLEELKAVPSAHGWSALDSFYASHPVVEGEEEYYLDPALWREPIRKAGSVSAAGLSGSAIGGADTSAAPMSSRRMGLWTGTADGTLVDTSIRPAQEQLRRQGAMPLQTVAPDSIPADSVAGMVWPAGTGTSAASAGAAPHTASMSVAAGAAGMDVAAGSGESAPVSDREGVNGAAGQAAADAPTSQKPLHVEFWESPVHYKGYQLNGNNLILYGINDADSLRFENHPDGVWMYHKEAVYRLTSSSEMQRFELISGKSSLEEPEGASEAEAADGAK